MKNVFNILIVLAFLTKKSTSLLRLFFSSTKKVIKIFAEEKRLSLFLSTDTVKYFFFSIFQTNHPITQPFSLSFPLFFPFPTSILCKLSEENLIPRVYFAFVPIIHLLLTLKSPESRAIIYTHACIIHMYKD